MKVKGEKCQEFVESETCQERALWLGAWSQLKLWAVGRARAEEQVRLPVWLRTRWTLSLGTFTAHPLIEKTLSGEAVVVLG